MGNEEEESVQLEYANKVIDARELFANLAKANSIELKGPNRHSNPQKRTDRISDSFTGLASILNGEIFEGGRDVSEGNVDKLITTLAYEAAKSKIAPHEISIDYDTFIKDPDQINSALRDIAAETGNDTIGNYMQFKKDILNSDTPTNPTLQEFDSTTPLGILINYISTQNDEESRIINRANATIAQNWQKSDVAAKLIEAANRMNDYIDLKLGPGATAQEFLSEYNRQVSATNAMFNAQNPKKTYKATGTD